MPELPEVETIRRGLQKHLIGKRLREVTVRDPRLRWPIDEKNLRELLLGRGITGVARRAKYLLVNFEQDNVLILHLGMSGRLLLLSESTPVEKHDHVVFHFDDASELRFRDPRRFGLVDATSAARLAAYPRFTELGVEPLAADTDPLALYENVRRLQKPIKNLLMDSNFIVGVGNIYANESLFYAGVHPLSQSRELTLARWQKVFAAIQNVLERAIAQGGTTLNDFVDSNGDSGYFQLSLAVYGKTGEPCSRCGTAIERIVLAGRSTFFCSKCQPR